MAMPKVGQMIRVTCDGDGFFSTGDIAIVESIGWRGTFFADFNRPGQIAFEDGHWWVCESEWEPVEEPDIIADLKRIRRELKEIIKRLEAGDE